MKQSHSLGNALVVSLALVLGFNGCATNPPLDGEPSVEPRSLGKEFKSFSAPALTNGAVTATNAPAPIRAEEPIGVVTLRQALAVALMKNPELAVFSWETRAAEARMLQASLRPNPELGVGSEHFGGSGAVRGVDVAETTIQLSQLIELSSKRHKRTRIASLERDLAAWDYESRRLDVLTHVTESFVDALAAQNRLTVLEELVGLAQEVLDTIAERVKAGKVSPAEEMRAGVALSTSRIELERAKRELEAARKRLAASWGSTAPAFDRAEGQLEGLKPIPSAEQLANLLSNNPDIARWATEMEQRRGVLELERAKRIPDVTVGAGTRYYSETGDGGFLAGVSVPLPLFNRNQGATREARYRLAKAEAETKVAEVAAQRALADAYQALSTAHTETSALRDDVLPKAQSAFDTTRERYLQGKFAYVDVLDAQRTLFEVRTRYIEAMANYHKAVADVERLIGQPLDALSTEQK